MEMAVATLIAGADPDLYVKGVKINEGSDDNINVRASIVVRDTEVSHIKLVADLHLSKQIIAQDVVSRMLPKLVPGN